MIKSYNKNILENDIPANKLIKILEENESVLDVSDSYIYHNFPLYIGYEENKILTNVLLLSKKYGLILFQCVSDHDLGNIAQTQDQLEQSYSQVFSKLIRSKKLRKGFDNLAIKITPIIFLNPEGVLSRETKNLMISYEESTILTDDDLLTKFKKIQTSNVTEDIINETRSVLEGSKAIRKELISQYDITKEKGKILHDVDSKIALFDSEQRSASFFIHNKPQRIRGLAGSGKTIVLAMKAAQILLNEPDAKILYTFYTKTLYDLIKTLITRFYRQYSEKDPDWNNIKIMHAWGGANLPGVYYNACILNGIAPITLSQVNTFSQNKFEYVCGEILDKDLKKEYDYALLDEAQDFPSSFYKLCRKITRDDKIIWAYDEFQNVIDIKLQNPEKTFGADHRGVCINLTDDSDQDIILHKCYRNDRRILVVAFALGLGIYNDKILQMPEDNSHWEDLGFIITKGNSQIGDDMIINRPEENSPINIADKNNVTIKSFEGNQIENECNYVVGCIRRDIENGIPPEEILIISLDDRNARKYFKAFVGLLNPILPVFNLSEAPFNNKIFKHTGHITLSTVYRAKGNEAGSVYIVGTDSVFLSKDSIIERNKLFTAITRAKLWVTLTGTGNSMKKCEEEIGIALGNFPDLRFIMPDPGKLKTIQRDFGQKLALTRRIKKLREDAKKQGIEWDEIINSQDIDKK